MRKSKRRHHHVLQDMRNVSPTHNLPYNTLFSYDILISYHTFLIYDIPLFHDTLVLYNIDQNDINYYLIYLIVQRFRRQDTF